MRGHSSRDCVGHCVGLHWDYGLGTCGRLAEQQGTDSESRQHSCPGVCALQAAFVAVG